MAWCTCSTLHMKMFGSLSAGAHCEPQLLWKAIAPHLDRVGLVFYVNSGGQIQVNIIKRAAEEQSRKAPREPVKSSYPPLTSSRLTVHLQFTDVMRTSINNTQRPANFHLTFDAKMRSIQGKVRAVSLCGLLLTNSLTRKHFVAVVWMSLYPSSLSHLVPKLKEYLPSTQFQLNSARPLLTVVLFFTTPREGRNSLLGPTELWFLSLKLQLKETKWNELFF